MFQLRWITSSIGWRREVYSLSVSTGFLTSSVTHRLSISTTSHFIPCSHASFRPWQKPHNSATVTEQCPIFIPKPKIQAPLWSRITPALDAPVRLQAPSVFNLHHGQVGASPCSPFVYSPDVVTRPVLFMQLIFSALVRMSWSILRLSTEVCLNWNWLRQNQRRRIAIYCYILLFFSSYSCFYSQNVPLF